MGQAIGQPDRSPDLIVHFISVNIFCSVLTEPFVMTVFGGATVEEAAEALPMNWLKVNSP